MKTESKVAIGLVILLFLILMINPSTGFSSENPTTKAIECVNKHTQAFVNNVPSYEVLFRMNAAMCKNEIMAIEGFTDPIQVLNFSIGATGQSLLWWLQYELQMNNKEIEEANKETRLKSADKGNSNNG